jgi:hypothetical protein
MATPCNRRELFLGHGRVFVETPRLITDDEHLMKFIALEKKGAQVASIATQV